MVEIRIQRQQFTGEGFSKESRESSKVLRGGRRERAEGKTSFGGEETFPLAMALKISLSYAKFEALEASSCFWTHSIQRLSSFIKMHPRKLQGEVSFHFCRWLRELYFQEKPWQ